MISKNKIFKLKLKIDLLRRVSVKISKFNLDIS